MNYNNQAKKLTNSSSNSRDPFSPKRMAAYCRVSTKDDILLKSLENQIAYFLHLGKDQQNWNMVGLYVDRGKSGTSQKHRLGLQRLLRHCEEGKIDLILTKSISRFSRNAADLLNILRRLRALNVEVIFEKEGIKTSELDTDFILQIYGAFAEREVLNISQNIEWSYRKKSERGIPNFQRILGYDVTRTDGSIEIAVIPEEAEIVREIFNKFTEGIKVSHIAKSLNTRKVPTIKGFLSWQPPQINYLLKNSRYLGNTTSHPPASSLVREITGSTQTRESYFIENTHPPIITQDIFDAAQEIFNKRKKPIAKAQRYPLSSRVRCGTCGSNLILVYQLSGKHKWKCYLKAKDNSICNSRPMWEYEIKELLVKALESRFGPPTRRSLLKIKSIVMATHKSDSIENQRMEYYRRLQEAKNLSVHENRAINNALVETIENEFLLFERVSAELEDDSIYRSEFIDSFDSTISTLNKWDDLSLSLIRALIRDIVVFDKSTFQVNWSDARITTVGNCPLHWPVNPVNTPANLTKGKSSGEKSVISTSDHRALTSIKPLVNMISNLNLHSTNAKQQVAAYCRVSTLNEEQTQSLAMQIAYYLNLILQNPDWIFAGIFIDEGISGTKIDNRPNFKKMIKYAKAGKIDLILTKSVSRFARNTLDCLATVRELKSLERPTGVWFESENIHTLSNMGELTLSLFSSLAQEEAVSFGANARFSKIKKIESGKYIHGGRPPYGFVIDENKDWIAQPEEKVAIVKMFSMYQKGSTTVDIANYLDNHNIPTPGGGKDWHASFIRKLLSNPVYLGHVVYQKSYIKDTLTREIVPNKGDLPKYVIENHHEAFIDQSTWDDVQDRLAATARPSSNSGYSKDPFLNLVYCSEVSAYPSAHIHSNIQMIKSSQN